MGEYFALKNIATATGASLIIDHSKITYANIRCTSSTSWKSGPLVRAKSWTSLASPQKKQRTGKSERTFELHFMYIELEKIANDDTVLKKAQSDQCVWRNK